MPLRGLYFVELRDAFALPARANVQLIWTDQPVAAKAPPRLRALRENWQPYLATGGVVIALELGDGSERSQAQIAADILSTTEPGDLVVDPFCGTGTTGLVALAHGRAFYGCDTDPNMVRRTRVRLATGVDPDHAA